MRPILVISLALLSLAGCGGGGGEDPGLAGADTVTVPGADTMSQPTVVPTVDTVTTTTTVDPAVENDKLPRRPPEETDKLPTRPGPTGAEDSTEPPE